MCEYKQTKNDYECGQLFTCCDCGEGFCGCGGCYSCNRCEECQRDDEWERLGDTPIDENEEIVEEFLHFEKGTCIYYIWEWFEEEYNCRVGTDLNNP